MKTLRILALLCYANAIGAQSYYEKSTVPPKSEFYVIAYGAKCNGATDGSDSAGIAKAATAAAVSGGTLVFTGSCSINTAISVGSNVDVSCRAATITPVALGSWVGAANDQTFVGATNATNFSIQGCRIVYPIAYGGGSHMIELYATNSGVLIKDNIGTNAGSMVSDIGATNVTIINNRYTGSQTACWGTWNGATGLKVINNYCTLGTLATYGIEFTGETTALTAAISTDFVATGNTIRLSAAGQVAINVDGLTSGCAGNAAENYGTIADNHIFMATGASGWAVLLRFCANYFDIHDNQIFSDGTDNTAPAIGSATPNTNVLIHHNIVYNWTNSNAAGNERGAFRNTAVGGTITFNECYSCTLAAGIVGNTDATTLVFGNDSGTGAISFVGNLETSAGGQIDWLGRGILTSPAAGQIQFGATNAASPVDQTLIAQGSRSGTDVDVAGGNLSISSGRGTGAATGSTLQLVSSNPTTTGSAQQTNVLGLAITAPALTFGNTTSNPSYTFRGTGATSFGGALSVTGLFTPTATTGIGGTTGADQPAAGSMGEVASIHCVVGAAGAAASTVTMTIATPAVVTWSSHTFVPSTGLANYTCPINFTTTGALPTGVVAGTNYYIIGSSVSGDTFQISDTSGHALAATNSIATSGTQSGTQAAYIGALGTTNTPFAAAALKLVAGDWDCSAVGEFQELTSLTTTGFASAVDTSAVITTIGNVAQARTASTVMGAFSYYQPTPVVRQNLSATTSVFAVTQAAFSGGTMNEGASLRCRRMR